MLNRFAPTPSVNSVIGLGKTADWMARLRAMAVTVYRRGSPTRDDKQAEREAREHKRGLWGSEAVPACRRLLLGTALNIMR